MLGAKDAMATVAVTDLPRARRFYGETLGLREINREGEEAVVYGAGSARLLVYRSQFAGSNRATSVSWNVGDEIDALARELAAKGVPFERYDTPDGTHEGDVHVFGAHRVAWFTDPDGAIHALVNG